jgi:hypothetical protein
MYAAQYASPVTLRRTSNTGVRGFGSSIFDSVSSRTTVFALICWLHEEVNISLFEVAPQPTFIHMSDVPTCPLMASSLYRPELLCSRGDEITRLWCVERDSCDDDAVRVWCAPIDTQDVHAVVCTFDQLLVPVEPCGARTCSRCTGAHQRRIEYVHDRYIVGCTGVDRRS